MKGVNKVSERNDDRLQRLVRCGLPGTARIELDAEYNHPIHGRIKLRHWLGTAAGCHTIMAEKLEASNAESEVL
jgi:hypothetical protein